MDGQDWTGIWVFAEQRGGQLHEVGAELLGKARELADQAGWKVTAVLLGDQVEALADTLIGQGADHVLVGDDPELRDYRLLAYTRVLAEWVETHRPEVFLLGATAMGMELAPRVAARVRTGLSAHCIDLRLDEKQRLLQVVPGWGGGLIATILCPEKRPQMATVMPGIMKALEPCPRTGRIHTLPVNLEGMDLGPRVLETVREKPEGLPLEKAEVVVAGGWGVGSQENWALVEALAQALGGAVGATRPPVDEGWADEKQMIGQSGKTVRPTLYIGMGISGVMHHVVGMDQSRYVISINTDPGAEIFEVSDLFVVEDFKKVVPKLIEEIQRRRGPA